jgi:hypothetical protein
MADGTEDLGGVAISIDGDYSALAAAFSNAETLASAAGEAIADSFTAGVADSNELTSAVQQTGDAAKAAGAQMSLFGDDVEAIPFADVNGQLNLFTDELEPLTSGMNQAADAADSAAAAVGHFGDAEEEASPATHEAASGVNDLFEAMMAFAGVEISVEALKDFATEALTTYSSVEQAVTALTALTGSATQAGEEIEQLKDLALSDALSFPSLVAADQKMTALGIDAQAIPGILAAAGDAAKATGNDFDTMTGAIDRIALTGTISSRALATLGLSLQDFASALGVSADEVKDKFAEMDPTERVQTITDALGKFAGVAHDTAGSISGEWQNLKTETEFAFEAVGNAIAPVASILLQLGGSVVAELADAYKSTITVFTGFASAVSAAIEPLTELVSSLQAVKDAAGPAASIVGTIWGILKDYNGFALAADAIRGIGNAISYVTGTVPDAATMTQAMTDKLTQLQKSGTDATATMKQVADSVSAILASQRDASNAISVYADALSDAQAKYDKVVASYNAGKAAAADLISAQNSLTAAQNAYNEKLSELPDVVKPTQAFDTALGDLATQEQIAAAGADAQKVKLDALLLNLGLANDHLVTEVQNYKDAQAAGSDLTVYTQNLTRALSDQQAAQKALNDVTGDWAKISANPPSLAPMFDETTKAILASLDSIQKFLPAVDAPDKPAQTLDEDFKALKLTVDDLGDTVSTKLLNAFDDLSNHSEITLQEVEAAWGKVSAAVNKLSQTDMPAALTEYQRYIDLLNASGASEYQVQQAIAAKLAAEIKYAEQSGTDATAAISQLTNIQLAQAAAKDQADAFGTAYSDALKDISGGFQTMGKDIADNIAEGKSWHDVWEGFLQDIEKEILEQLIGIAFKTLGDTVASAVSSLLGVGKAATDAVTSTVSFASDATQTIGDTAKTASTAVSSTATSATSAVGAVGSAVMSTIGAIGSAVGGLASIFSIFQNMQQETTLNAIEHNTRYAQIEAEQLDAAVMWPMFENTTYMVGTLNDVSQHLNGMLATEQVWLPFLGDAVTHLLVLTDIESEMDATLLVVQQYLPFLKTISDEVALLGSELGALAAASASSASSSQGGATNGRRAATSAAEGLQPADFSSGLPTAASSTPAAAAGAGGITLNVDLSGSTYGASMTPRDLSDAVFNAANRLLRTSGARY